MSLIPLSLYSSKPPVLGPRCRKCGMDKHCESPKMRPSGEGRRKILIVGEFPGRDEDRQGRPMVGASGELLRKLLLKCGVDIRADCVITNALACNPRKEAPEGKHADYCRPNVLDAIDRHQPNVVIPMGKLAVRSVIGHLWKEDTGGVGRWAGFAIPNRKPNLWVCPTANPAYLLRLKDRRGEYKDRGLAERWVLRHLQKAIDLAASPPWREIPDYSKAVKVVYDSNDAARLVRKMMSSDRAIAVDYETTCLKPDGPDARIVCCAVGDGETAVAYPWVGEARTATGELLRSGHPLIASNMAFEDRWTWKEFGHAAVGFRSGWDTMLQAHTIDGRPGIASIKFQSFVLLGQEDYDSGIHRFLEGRHKGSYSPNRIKEIDTGQLARYCGTDAHLEWLVARKQSEILNIEVEGLC